MLWTKFDCASFHASADSLPPLPTSNIMRLRSSIERKGKGKGLGGDGCQDVRFVHSGQKRLNGFVRAILV